MNNVLTVSELKRRGMAAIDEAMQRGPVHILKRNKPAAVVLSEAEYRRLSQGQGNGPQPGMTAVQWLLTETSAGRRSRAQIDAALKKERDW